MSFLKAEWRKLAIVNYEVDEKVLLPYIPHGTELDLWKGRCYISLVGFMFLNTKLLGLSIPFHRDFEEVNLRFYVRRYVNDGFKRGVVFIKELVPKPALTFVANTVYNENYETVPMAHEWIETDAHRKVTYKWRKENKWHALSVIADRAFKEIEAESETEFITEHYWGYAKVSEFKTNEYEVRHPRWNSYDVLDYDLDIDFGATYGAQFEFLNDAKPTSVMLAEGSEISVESKRSIYTKQIDGL